MNGWARSGNPWASQADESEQDVPSWRRPAQEIRPFTRQPPGELPSDDIRPFPEQPPARPEPIRSEPIRPEQIRQEPMVPEQRPPAEPEPPAPHWSDSGRRYDDLLKHFSSNRGEAWTPPRFNNLPRPDTLQDDEDLRPNPAARTRDGEVRDIPTPSSAPPYPYEGDLDDAYRPPPPQQQARQRPAPPGIRRNEPARHALDPTPPEGTPRIEPSGDGPRVRPAYDPVTFPRRLPYETPPGPTSAPPAAPASPAPASAASFAAQREAAQREAVQREAAQREAAQRGAAQREAEREAAQTEPDTQGLPQRVPAKPDVPAAPEPPAVEPSAEAPELDRIANHLRRDDVLAPQDRQEGFDVQAILAAVREVEGVRDAMLRATPAGANSLRLDLAEGADPAEVSRQVARLLQDRMGLDAAMQGTDLPPRTPPQAPFVPSQPGPSEPVAGSAPSPVADLRDLPTVPQQQYQQQPPAREREREPEQVPTSPPRPLNIGHEAAPRVMIDNVQVTTFGTEASVEVRLVMGDRVAKGVASGPAIDGYLLRLCAAATVSAINELLATADDRLDGPARCYVEHAGAVSFGASQVAVVVLLLSCGGWVEQLAGSAIVGNDGRHAMVRATLAATNRRLEALLSR